jgi:serine protease inhibitor
MLSDLEIDNSDSPFTFRMVCDKPFAFVLEKDDQILFMGAVNNPDE